MWGKSTARKDRAQTNVISELKKYSFLVTPGIEVTNLMFSSDDVVWIRWGNAAEEHVPNLRHTNEVKGAYVTGGAIIHLYRPLDRLGENSIYCQTDNLIYIKPTDEPQLIETGDNQGDMTSELPLTQYTWCNRRNGPDFGRVFLMLNYTEKPPKQLYPKFNSLGDNGQ